MTRFRTILAVICVLIISISAILILDRGLGRTRLTDLTEDHIYTLSEGTERIVGQLQSPITLKLYYSRTGARRGPAQLRTFNSHFLYTRDLLQEFERISDGKLKVEIIDPRPGQDEEDAMAFGLRRFQINEDETFFFGLAAVSSYGKEATIPFMNPERQSFLEYDIAKLLVDLMQRQKTTIGVISALPVMGADLSPYMLQMMQLQGQRPDPPWIIARVLQQTYDVQTVEATDGALPDDLDYLLLIHPKDLDEGTLYAIDQYVMAGGKLIVFTDPHSIFDRPPQPQNPMMPPPQASQASDLNALLDKWGVHQKPETLAVDRELGVTTQFRPNQRPEKLRAYLQLTDDQTNDDNVAVAELKEVRMIFAGVLEPSDSDEAGEVEWLLRTSQVGNDWKPSNPYVLQMLDIAAINKETTDGSEPVWLGAMITGELSTNYPDGVTYTPTPEPPPSMPGQPPPPPPPSEPVTLPPAPVASTDSGMVAVIADVDMLGDMIAFQNMFGVDYLGDNANLLLNLLEYMGGNRDLISIRNRGEYRRPFTTIQELKDRELKEATEREEKLEEERQAAEDEIAELANQTNLQDQASVDLFTGEFYKKRRELQDKQEEIAQEIRALRAERIERIAAVETQIKAYTTWPVPIALVLIMILLWIYRTVRARQFAARRDA